MHIDLYPMPNLNKYNLIFWSALVAGSAKFIAVPSSCVQDAKAKCENS